MEGSAGVLLQTLRFGGEGAVPRWPFRLCLCHSSTTVCDGQVRLRSEVSGFKSGLVSDALPRRSFWGHMVVPPLYPHWTPLETSLLVGSLACHAGFENRNLAVFKNTCFVG